MNVSVIIVAFNSGPLLIECVRNALASVPPCEVIVSDNGSTDCSIEPLADMADHEPRLKILRNHRNLGFARGNNAALRLAGGNYVLFLNPDCLLAPESIERVLGVLTERPDAGMAGCRIRNPDGSEEPSARRRIPTPGGLLRRFLGQSAGRPDSGEPDRRGGESVEAISGAFMLVRRACLDRVGSFDEGYFLHWEDLDLCLRFGRAGYPVLFVGDVEVVHFKGRSSFRRPLRVEFHKHAGLVRFMRKFYFARWPLPLFAIIAAPIWVRFAYRALRLSREPGSAPQPGITPAAAHQSDEIWVFGASSLIGRWLLPRLVAAGYRVRAFCRDPDAIGAADSPHLSWHAHGLNPDAPLPSFGRPETLIHLAPLYTLPPAIQALAERGVRRIIAFSSTSRFTKLKSSAAGERAVASALAGAEEEIGARCTGLGIRWTVLRPTLIYSLGDDRNVTLLWQFIRRFGFFPMPGAGSGKRQPVHADDLAKACIALLGTDKGWNRAYNLSGGETLSFRAMVEAIFRQIGRQPRIVTIPRAGWRALLMAARLLPAFRDVRIEMLDRVDVDLCFEHEDAKTGFGFEPGGFRLR